jgi:hypothetical protein
MHLRRAPRLQLPRRSVRIFSLGCFTNFGAVFVPHILRPCAAQALQVPNPDIPNETITGDITVPEIIPEFLTVPEIAKRTKLDRHVITELFKSEPGVLVYGNTETRKRRRKYVSYRVPVAVVARVLARMTNR